MARWTGVDFGKVQHTKYCPGNRTIETQIGCAKNLGRWSLNPGIIMHEERGKGTPGRSWILDKLWTQTLRKSKWRSKSRLGYLSVSYETQSRPVPKVAVPALSLGLKAHPRENPTSRGSYRWAQLPREVGKKVSPTVCGGHSLATCKCWAKPHPILPPNCCLLLSWS